MLLYQFFEVFRDSQLDRVGRRNVERLTRLRVPTQTRCAGGDFQTANAMDHGQAVQHKVSPERFRVAVDHCFDLRLGQFVFFGQHLD